MTEKTRNLIVRTLSGGVLLAIVIAAILVSRWGYAALITVITAGGIWELMGFAEKAGYAPQKYMGEAIGLLLIAAAAVFVEGVTANSGSITIFIVLLMAIVILLSASFIIELFRESKTPMQNIASTFLGVIYVAMPMAAAYLIPFISDVSYDGWNPMVALSYIFIVWANDVFAYLTGITIGRHRLCERLSPKKSWEGFFGGIAGAIIMGAVAALYMNANIVLWCAIGLVTALAGAGGDLTESMFKRSIGVKDSGNILPGHGGFLDRFDAMLLSTPLVFLIFIIYAIL